MVFFLVFMGMMAGVFIWGDGGGEGGMASGVWVFLSMYFLCEWEGLVLRRFGKPAAEEFF